MADNKRQDFEAQVSLLAGVPLDSLTVPDSVAAYLKDTGAKTLLDALRVFYGAGSLSGWWKDSLHYFPQRCTQEDRKEFLELLLSKVPPDVRKAEETMLQDWDEPFSEWERKFAADAIAEILDSQEAQAMLAELDWSNCMVMDRSKLAKEIIPFDRMTKREQDTVVSCVELYGIGIPPMGMPYEQDETDYAIFQLRFRQGMDPDYALTILREREPEYTPEQLKRREWELRVMTAGVAALYALTPPLTTLYAIAEPRGDLDELSDYERANPLWYREVLRYLYPKQFETWEQPIQACYDDWIRCVIISVAATLMTEAPENSLAYLLQKEPPEDVFCSFAERYDMTRSELREFLHKVTKALRKPGIRSLLLDGCPHGSRIEQEFPFFPVDMDDLGDIQIKFLRLEPKVQEKLEEILEHQDIRFLTMVIWPHAFLEEPLRKAMGEKTFHGIRAYLLHNGIYGRMADIASDNFEVQSILTGILGLISEACGAEGLFPASPPRNWQGILAGCLTCRQVLYGYKPVPGYEPTSRNFYTLLLFGGYMLTSAGVKKVMAALGEPIEGDAWAYARNLLRAIAPEVNAGLNRGILNAAKYKSLEEYDAASRRILARI